MAKILALLTVFAAMASATVNQTNDRQLQTTDPSFCWKTSQPRGIGQLPSSCAAGQERRGLQCYDKCPVGTTRKGLDCHSYNPAGIAAQGATPTLATCAANEDFDAGLCYPKCNPNYTGVGPMCLAPPPATWVDCGMGAAKTPSDCDTAVKGQIMSVGQLALKIVVAFAGSSPMALRRPADASKFAELTKAWDVIKYNPSVKRAIKTYDNANRGKAGYQTIEELEKTNSTAEDYVNMATSIASIIASIFDLISISDAFVAFKYSICDKVAA
ncbi:hypothetical protein B5M09_005344 [Aphanomyces astaci]|uniref:Uncharacterized protein n=1 Tax=Aphanomyces astaci TaxID=112090 RepID=A0A425CX16_APHAT|nr:hypothetical protein B5M09_005344 [Aphanomyces astaci]